MHLCLGTDIHWGDGQTDVSTTFQRSQGLHSFVGKTASPWRYLVAVG